MKVEKNKVVSFAYTLKDDDGEILDQAGADQPLVYLHGVGGIIRGIESALESKSVGDAFEVSVSPEDAYGDYDDDQVRQIERQFFEDMEDIEVGSMLLLETEDETLEAEVIEIQDDFIVVDCNHELAGLNLHFEILVTDIRDATAEEIEHGHVHGEGGHDHG